MFYTRKRYRGINMTLSNNIVRLLASIAEDKASHMTIPMAVAFADERGGLIFFTRMDGCLPAGTEIAISKAYTSAILQMSTSEVGKIAQPGKMLYGIQNILNGKIVLFGGGMPLYLNGKIAGAVGVSGGTVKEDVLVAQPVMDALAEMERLAGKIKPIVSAKPLVRYRNDWIEKQIKNVLDRLDLPLSPNDYIILTGAILLAAGKKE